MVITPCPHSAGMINIAQNKIPDTAMRWTTTLLALLFLGNALCAQSLLVSYPLTSSGAPNPPVLGVEAQPFTANQTFLGLLPTVSFGPDGAEKSNWTTGGAPDGGSYFQVGVSPSPGFSINVSRLNFSHFRDDVGIGNYTVAFSYSQDFSAPFNITTRTVADNENIQSGDIIGLNINVSPGQTLYVRWYGYNAETVRNTWTMFANSLELLGTVTSLTNSSTESDIVRDPGFDEPDNFDYKPYTVASGLSTANALQIGSFTIRDGGADGTDADLDPTKLTALTLSVNLPNAIKALALFDGSSNISEQAFIPANGEVTFSGLTLEAPDEGTKSFGVYATFNELGVVDNEQVQVSVRTVNSLGNGATSVYALSNGGGAFTSVTGDNNRIEVMASAFRIVQQPTNVEVGDAIAPAVMVQATDSHGRDDLDYTGTVTATPLGVAFDGGAQPTAAAAGGIAAFSALSFAGTATGATLNLTDVGIGAAAVSAPFDVIDLPVAYFSEFTYRESLLARPNFLEVALEASRLSERGRLNVYLYKGRPSNGDGTLYGSLNLSTNFTVETTSGGLTYLVAGGIDLEAEVAGMALYYDNILLEFISYGGTINAIEGPADGESSTNIGVTEPLVPIATSIQRTGTCSGVCPSGLVWQAGVPQTEGGPEGGAALPVELLSFTARPEGKEVLLQWRTATELNNDYMAVEHSTDGRNFAEIGRRSGAGTTQEPQHYFLVHAHPADGLNYYRLRQADFDGQVNYFPVAAVEVSLEEPPLWLAFPTVARERIQLRFTGTAAPAARVRVISPTGKILADEPWLGQAELPVGHLPKGAYIVQLLNGDAAAYAARFVKQ